MEQHGTGTGRGANTGLLSALRAIAWHEALSVRQDAFADIAARKPLIRWVAAVHRALHPGLLSDVMIGGYALRACLGLKAVSAPILATCVFANEKRSIAHIRSCAGQDIVVPVSYRLAHMLAPASLAFLARALRRPGRIAACARLIHRINRSLPFMPACRTAATLGLYLRYVAELRRLQPRAILTAADYSPDGLALAAAARRLGIATIYTCHAFPPADIPRFPLRFTLSFLYAEKVAELYRRTAPITGRIVYTGIEGAYRPMRLEGLRGEGMRLGIFLSGMQNLPAMARIVSEAQQRLNPSSILFRKHPVALNNADLTPLLARYPHATETFGTPMTDDLDRCDLIIIGNSGALLQVLKYGVPAVYMPPLEDIPEDYNGFAAAAIVPLLRSLDGVDIAQMRAFYADPAWARRFAGYDHGYGHAQDTEAAIRRAVLELIGRPGA